MRVVRFAIADLDSSFSSNAAIRFSAFRKLLVKLEIRSSSILACSSFRSRCSVDRHQVDRARKSDFVCEDVSGRGVARCSVSSDAPVSDRVRSNFSFSRRATRSSVDRSQMVRLATSDFSKVSVPRTV
jgi:hypothetical protein